MSTITDESFCSPLGHDEKVVLITGCSSGIGQSLAIQLSSKCNNYRVLATMRKVVEQPETMNLCDLHPLDVVQDKSVEKILQFIDENYGGRVDILINNAGYGVPGCLEDVSISAAQSVFDVNVWGPMRLVQAVAPRMRRTGTGGLIVNVSSISGVIGQPFSDIYTASKQALEGMFESYRYSVAKDNIKVLSVNPGPTVTSFGERFKKEADGGAYGIVHRWASEISHRNENGQTAEECAAEIIKVIEREIVKDVSKPGAQLATMWNGTSDFSRHIVNSVKKFPDGASGTYAERLAVARQMFNDFNS